MANKVQTSDYLLPPIDSGVVLTKLVQSSAIAKLVPQIPLSGSGSVFHTFASGDAEYVTESGLKPVVSVTGGSFEVDAKKFAKAIVLTDESVEDSPAIGKAALESVPEVFASILDRIAIGTKAKPSGNFDTLAAAPSMEIDTVADLYAAIDTVEANDVTADGILFTSSMLNHLSGKVNSLGLPVFNISGGEINGIPYAVIKSSVKAAFVGPFATRAVWGIVPGYPKVTVHDDVVEVDGVLRALWQHNEIAVLGETRIGFRVADVNEFVKLVPATVAS